MNIAAPEALGFSSERLARLAPAMQRYVDDKKLAGIVTLIARRGQLAHFEKFGWADMENNRPIELDTIFRIYSMTKPITSVAVLMLLEEGRLHIADPVSRYIPAFKNVRVLDNTAGSGVRFIAPTREINLRDLLTHTAGLSYGFEENVYIDELYRKVWAEMEKNADLTLQEFIERIAKFPLAFQPGTAFRYSVATDVLGYLVQVVSGMPFEDFLKQRILDPLGMADTAFHVPPDKLDHFCANYGPAEQGGLKVIDPVNSPQYTRPSKCPSGGGGLVSTATDYWRFAQMLLNGGELDGARLLGRKTVEFMLANHLPPHVHPFDEAAFGFGLGGNVLLDVGKSPMLGSVGTFGWGGAANTNFWIDRQEQLIGVLMLQFMPSDTHPVKSDFRNLTYQALVA